jgi:hypothetical protein
MIECEGVAVAYYHIAWSCRVVVDREWKGVALKSRCCSLAPGGLGVAVSGGNTRVCRAGLELWPVRSTHEPVPQASISKECKTKERKDLHYGSCKWRAPGSNVRACDVASLQPRVARSWVEWGWWPKQQQRLRDLARRGAYHGHAKTTPSHPDLTGRRGRRGGFGEQVRNNDKLVAVLWLTFLT